MLQRLVEAPLQEGSVTTLTAAGFTQVAPEVMSSSQEVGVSGHMWGRLDARPTGAWPALAELSKDFKEKEAVNKSLSANAQQYIAVSLLINVHVGRAAYRASTWLWPRCPNRRGYGRADPRRMVPCAGPSPMSKPHVEAPASGGSTHGWRGPESTHQQAL